MPPLYSLTNLYGIAIWFVAFLKYNSYWISAWPISTAWYPYLVKSWAKIVAVGPKDINIKVFLSTFRAAFNILSYI